MELSVLIGGGLAVASALLLLLALYVGIAFVYSWMTNCRDLSYVRYLDEAQLKTRPETFVDSEEIWYMAMDHCQPRKSYWITENHAKMLRRADPSVRKHGEAAIQRIVEEEKATVTIGGEKTEVTKTIADGDEQKKKKKKLKDMTTQTAKTEEVEARWNKKNK